MLHESSDQQADPNPLGAQHVAQLGECHTRCFERQQVENLFIVHAGLSARLANVVQVVVLPRGEQEVLTGTAFVLDHETVPNEVLEDLERVGA